MEKELSEMSLEELWQLFPIFLTEHKAVWKDWFEEEKSFLEKILPQDRIVRIGHIGSTSIGAIWAKPIIDILVEVYRDCNMVSIKQMLCENGYICMSQNGDGISFNKGYTPKGFAEKVFHLHLRYKGDNDELYFRDYLMEHTDIALEYERLKMDLWKKYEHDRDGYTDAKTEFVAKYTKDAKKLYGKKYD